MLFAWDPNKATANFRKHRLTFDEAATVFSVPLALTRLPRASGQNPLFMRV